MKSRRDLIRDYAEEAIKQAGEPLHNAAIAGMVLPQLNLTGAVSPKTVNTCLHDDPERRFIRVGKGTWWLRDRPHASLP